MQTIGVFFGGKSPEHEVSVVTGQLIISGLKKLGYPIVPVFIDKTGRWWSGERLGTIKAFTGQDTNQILKGKDKYYLDLPESRGKMVLRQKELFGEKLVIDMAFPALHGRYGEDGTIQGLFEMLDLPYVGCDVPSSAIAMDKVLTKLLYRAESIPTVPFIFFSPADWAERKREILRQAKKLHGPLFIKPARLGSSIGMAKVKSQKDLEFAVEVALHYDDKVVVEESVENLMDVTCAVMGPTVSPRPSLTLETTFEDVFYSYQDKYLNEGGTQTGQAKNRIIIPARLPDKTNREIQQLAVRIYQLFGCSGIARVDFLYDTKKKKVFANEVNTLPGTLYEHLWRASGVEFGELLTILLKTAETRQQERQKLIYSFESDVLKKLGSLKLKGGKGSSKL
ncbi:MAG: D-alanine--D-alanine ligase [Candidatus Liptonbacteria bacterium]|nr:D-alanine--D-alanine ligase [Candidatus Liptonbacteria bacterium]